MNTCKPPDLFGATLLHLIVLCVICLLSSVECQYDDVRCKCVCPIVKRANSTVRSSKIYIQSFNEPSRCKCENVVDEWVHTVDARFCDRCNCQWQRRNTMTIKVVVMFIIGVVSLLVLYMLFLMCLDPLLSRHHASYVEQRNEELAMCEVQESGKVASSRLPPVATAGDDNWFAEGPPGVVSRVRHEVRRVHGKARKWRSTVQEQRKNIYDRHTMLN